MSEMNAMKSMGKDIDDFEKKILGKEDSDSDVEPEKVQERQQKKRMSEFERTG